MTFVLRLLLAALLLGSLSCRTSKPAPSFGGGSEHFYAHRWVLVEADGQAVTPTGEAKEAHLLFTPPNRLAGSTGCNRLNGTFEFPGSGAIRFSPVATTRMACPDGAAESRFVNALGRVKQYQIDPQTLVLYDGSTVVARFRAQAAN